MASLRHGSSSTILIVGSLATAATTGALIAFGHRLGGVGLPFAAVAGALFRRTASGSSPGLVLSGLVIHAAVVFLWSGAFAWLIGSRGWRPMPAAFAVAVGAHLLSWIAAWSTGNGIASLLPLGDRLVLAVVLAIALVAGMRIARSLSQSA